MARILEYRSRYHKIDINQSLAGNTEVTVDGMILKGIRSIEFERSYETIPEVTVQLVPSVLNVNILADLNVALDIGDIQEAVNCLQLEMKLNKEFKDAVIASARSALADCKIENSHEIAKAVVDRIFFGDDEWCKSY